MIHIASILTIFMMALVTYSTRIAGYLLLRSRTLSPRAQTVMNTAPGCVFISVIAPYFVTPRPAELIALAITIVAAIRLPMLATVVTAVASAGLMRMLLQ